MLHKSHNGYNTIPNKSGDWLDLLATKLAEIRLSELGYNFIPGIALTYTRVKKYIEAKALIVKRTNSISDDASQERINS